MDDRRDDSFGTAAYGGDGWSPRQSDHRDELGAVWSQSAIDSEWRALEAVVVHTPGDELAVSATNPNDVQMLAPLDTARAAEEHRAMISAYETAGVQVHQVAPSGEPSPNLMFCADLFVMTPAGAILARPASTVRAGEERWMARRLADVGVPIIRTLTGRATFEGADLMWLDESTALIGRGPRTNQAGIDQIMSTLNEIGCSVIPIDLPYGAMHLMGLLRFLDRDLAIAWRRRTPYAAIEALRQSGVQVEFPAFVERAAHYRAINFVTLGPRRILMPAGADDVQSFYAGLGVECLTTPTEELSKAAGSTGCLTGVLSRQLA
ncbi:dimethylarginine dimethylaminohydrolase family protein [Actinomycetota bacterium]